jgi:hypothetical protein
MSRRDPALVLGLLLLFGAATPALGHVGLETSDPEAGTTVPDVDSVTLVFSEPLDEGASSFKLVAPDGRTVGTGAVAGSKQMLLDTVALEPGSYTVKWTAAGEDGHIERGKLSFTVAAAPVTGTLPGTATTPAPGSGGGPAEASQPAAPAAAASADVVAAAPSGTDVLVPIVAGLTVAGLVGFLVLRRSRTA